MSETLYRKYRPQKFDEVIGQDHITTVLKNSLENDSISHAYIFAGGRGTGKTSVARIFAKALGTSSNDLYEIDAASNRGIDDIRAIRDAVHTLPFESKYKVYIIDEAHMLTKEAWNALLKTLEEPPKHVLFILATTEFDKIPETILSRCESFSFKKPNQKILSEVIQKTAKKEGVKIADEAVSLIALLADGSFRDSHGILQKIINFSNGEKIEACLVEEITGAPKTKFVMDFLDALANREFTKAILILQTLEKENSDIKAFGKMLLDRIRAVMLIRIDRELSKDFADSLGEDTLKQISEYAEKNKNINSEMCLKFLKASSDIDFSPIATLPFEIVLSEMVESFELNKNL